MESMILGSFGGLNSAGSWPRPFWKMTSPQVWQYSYPKKLPRPQALSWLPEIAEGGNWQPRQLHLGTCHFDRLVERKQDIFKANQQVFRAQEAATGPHALSDIVPPASSFGPRNAGYTLALGPLPKIAQRAG